MMVAACEEIRVFRRRVRRWACVPALLLIAACGGGREAAEGEGSMASADTAGAAAPAPAATDTAPAAADTTGGTPPVTASKPADTASKPAATQPTKPAPRPAATPKPAPKPAPATPPTAAAQDTTTSQDRGSQDTASQDTATPAPAAQDSPQTADAPLRDAYHQPPKDTVDQATYDGWKQYNLNCARCHGEDVLGSTIAPHLVMSLKPDGPIPTQEAFVQVVCAGRPEKGMPSWCALGMEPATINQIYSYVKGRSEGKIRPGRPARREGS